MCYYLNVHFQRQRVNAIGALPIVGNGKVSVSENIEIVSSRGRATSKDAVNTQKYTVPHKDQAQRC